MTLKIENLSKLNWKKLATSTEQQTTAANVFHFIMLVDGLEALSHRQHLLMHQLETFPLLIFAPANI